MIREYYLSLTLLLLLLTGCSTTAQDDPQAFPTDAVAATQAEMDELTSGELPPGMVVWIDAPEYRFEGASGSANLTDDTPMPPEGAFRIGSITKMCTAVAIVQLAEDGVLTLDDPQSLVEMTTPAPASSNGLGIMLQEEYMGHAGGIAGFRSVLNYAPELDAVVVMLYNHDGADPEQSLADMMNPALPLLQVAE